jgi:hypothetical protein
VSTPERHPLAPAPTLTRPPHSAPAPPPQVMKRAHWDDEREVWVLERLSDIGKRETATGAVKRPVSASTARRPTSDFAKLANAMGDMNPRFKSENILNLELDLPERTTYDYEGPGVDPRVQVRARRASPARSSFTPFQRTHVCAFPSAQLNHVCRPDAALHGSLCTVPHCPAHVPCVLPRRPPSTPRSRTTASCCLWGRTRMCTWATRSATWRSTALTRPAAHGRRPRARAPRPGDDDEGPCGATGRNGRKH